MSSVKEPTNSQDPKQEWVQFDNDGQEISPRDNSPAILDTQPVQVTLENNRTNVESNENSPTKSIARTVLDAGNEIYPSSGHHPNQEISINVAGLSPANLQNIPLNDQAHINNQTNSSTHQQSTSVIRQGFANGDVIVTILPQNTAFPWITPAKFRPELVPEELMAHGLTLTVEDFVHVMTQLVNDHRFTIYNICYKRVLMAWITLAFLILLCILFGNFPHMVMFGLGIAWLMVNAGAIFFCMWIKIRLNKNLEKCMAGINLQLMKHKILLGCDDRGKISCHKLNLVFLYFDPQECIEKLQKYIDRNVSEATRNTSTPVTNFNERYDIEDPDVIITGSTNTRITQQQESKSALLLCKYSQRWAKEFLRNRLDWSVDASARIAGLAPPVAPRHLRTARCPCQYIEEHLNIKALRNNSTDRPPCSCLFDFCHEVQF